MTNSPLSVSARIIVTHTGTGAPPKTNCADNPNTLATIPVTRMPITA